MIGPHIIGSVSSYQNLIKQWKPKVALVLDPAPGIAATIKSWSPDTFLIGRVYRSDQAIRDYILRNPQEAAQWASTLVAEVAHTNPEVDIWQFNNEVCQTSLDEIAHLAEFTVRYIDLLAQNGLKAAIGCFSVGQPEAPENDNMQAWGAFVNAMRHGERHQAVLLIHAYGASRIFDIDDSWYLHRFEKRVRPYLPSDLQDMRYIYGEYGCDMGVLRPGHKAGWKTGYQDDHAAYANDLKQAANYLSTQHNCLGACVFTLGTNSNDWVDFDINGDAANQLAHINWPNPSLEPDKPYTIVSAPTHHYSSRQNHNVQYIIVHSTDTPVDGTVRDTIDWLISNPYGVSTHELIIPGKQVVLMLGDEFAAHHCFYGLLPNQVTGSQANQITWAIEMYQVRGQPVDSKVLQISVQRVVDACQRFGLTSNHILGHREVDPDRRTDPVGINMDQFRQAVAHLLGSLPPTTGDLKDILLQRAEQEQVIQFNKNAALQKKIFSDGFVPNSPEFAQEVQGVTYIAQRAEHLDSGKVRVYYVKSGDWGNVKFYRR